jgi:aspartyl protease family protein
MKRLRRGHRRGVWDVSNALKFALVTGLACVSAVAWSEALVTLAQRAPALRAAVATAPAVTAPATPSAAATIPKAADGHYWAEGQVDGKSVRFLVDTGASAVALTPADAHHLGIDTSDLKFSYKVVTASGEAHAAAVKLGSVTVAGARLDNVDALVIDKGLDTSLLGMSYLGRLSSFQATRGALILQP